MEQLRVPGSYVGGERNTLTGRDARVLIAGDSAGGAATACHLRAGSRTVGTGPSMAATFDMSGGAIRRWHARRARTERIATVRAQREALIDVLDQRLEHGDEETMQVADLRARIEVLDRTLWSLSIGDEPDDDPAGATSSARWAAVLECGVVGSGTRRRSSNPAGHRGFCPVAAPRSSMFAQQHAPTCFVVGNADEPGSVGCPAHLDARTGTRIGAPVGVVSRPRCGRRANGRGSSRPCRCLRRARWCTAR